MTRKTNNQPAVDFTSLATDYDLHLFNEGTHSRIYEKLGAHVVERNGVAGTTFAVWAPNARSVSVVGSFNAWNDSADPLRPRGASGVWEGFVPGVGQGAIYKYAIHSNVNGYRVQKADPLGFAAELRPRTASVVWDLSHYSWNDAQWMSNRPGINSLGAPMSIYEAHLGSWMRAENNRWLTYRELAETLPDYVHDMGFTHVEFLPVSEHPFDGSWGYQTVGYFAPTSRFGTPDDFRYLVDKLHQKEIGVILDWVPAHFPKDQHGLAYFDGTHLYEHSDPRQGEQLDWGTLVFNFGRAEVQSFLTSNAMFWLDQYHVDGLRVDAVASMLYLDYSRKEGQWIPNRYGGRENLEAIAFLRHVNYHVHTRFPDTLMMAEESTAWPQVTRPPEVGGLGYNLKWDMGWMHDTLSYFSKEPIHRKYHHDKLTFRMLYAFTENFALPLSHDEVVYGKHSLLEKMPGDDWQKFANLRLLLGYQWAQPGKKLLFMGGEFGQRREWDHDASLEWFVLDYAPHRGVQRFVRDLNTLYRGEHAFHYHEHHPGGFQWVDCNDSLQSVISLLRKGSSPDDVLLIACNFTPVPRHNYRLGVPVAGHWDERLNSDAQLYGGSGQGNFGGVKTSPTPMHGHAQSLSLTLPPLGMIVLSHRK